MTLGDLRLETHGTIVEARIRGEVDLSNAGELRDDLSRGISNDALGLILDLSDVHYLDSAGLHLIHHLREDLEARGQKLRLVIPGGSLIHDILDLAGLDWREEITATVEEARRLLVAEEQ
jgi:anti-anti-sigma factor